MSWFKTGCILGVVLVASSMTFAQTALPAPGKAEQLISEFPLEAGLDGRTFEGGSPVQIAEYPIGEAVAGGQRVVTAGAVYSDITTFTGYGATPPAGSPASGTTRVTKLLADDIQCMTGGGGDKLTSFTFSVGNLNAAAVSCMALIRIYADNASTPGTYLYGVNFTCSSFTASSVGLYTFSIPTASQPTIPANGKLWVGIAFMRTTGCTTATQTQLNNMTVGLYTPVDVGSSLDADYLSTANGGTDPNNVFKANNPAGAVRTAPYTTAAARHGYELISTLGACCVSSPTHYCAVMLQNACTAAGGTYLGAATTCSGLDCNGNGIDDKCDIAAGNQPGLQRQRHSGLVRHRERVQPGLPTGRHPG